MADKLNLMFDIQSAAQEEVMGQTLVGTKLTTEERVYWFDRNHTALLLELAEALEETSWKWWAKSTFFNEEQVQAELVDAWHFFLNLMNIANLTPAKLHQLYLAKRAINDARQANGYDGVSTKCPFCKRALDDPATQCYLPSGPTEVSPVGDMGFCMTGNRYYESEEVK
jgi:dimeric dUTPase (all-alpha-NTP-PPase superfamily)